MTKPLGIVVALMLSTPLYARGNKPKPVNFDVLVGMPVITVQTAEGKRRFVLDTGSVISSMDIKTDKELNLSVAGKQFSVRFRPTQTRVFLQFESLLPPTEHVDGILGSDFMRHFRHVTFDFNGRLVFFD
jgi:hypothetical protein